MLEESIKFKHMVTLNLIIHGKNYCLCCIDQYCDVFEFNRETYDITAPKEWYLSLAYLKTAA